MEIGRYAFLRPSLGDLGQLRTMLILGLLESA